MTECASDTPPATRGRITANTLLAALSVVLSLVVGEVALRLITPAWGRQPASPQWPQGLLAPHPTRGYTYSPNVVRVIATSEYRISVSTNSLGLRDREIRLAESVDILAAGDSFTAGYGIDAIDSWPKQLESELNAPGLRRTDVRVLNAGVSGYSVAQIRLTIEEFLSLHPRVVVLGLYPSRAWRLQDPYVYYMGQAVLRSSLPHLRPKGDGSFVYSEIDAAGLRSVHLWMIEHFQIGARLLSGIRTLGTRFERPKATSTEAEQQPLLEELSRAYWSCRRANVALVVLLVNHQEKDGTFHSEEKRRNFIVKRFCEQAGITVVDPIPTFEQNSQGRPIFRIGQDYHWSSAAHRLVAGLLTDSLESLLVDAQDSGLRQTR